MSKKGKKHCFLNILMDLNEFCLIKDELCYV